MVGRNEVIVHSSEWKAVLKVVNILGARVVMNDDDCVCETIKWCV